MKSHLLFILVFTCKVGLSQTYIQAVVADSQTRKVLPFATVRIAHTQSAVLTSIDGRFSIRVNSSDLHLLLSYVGYQQKEMPVSRIKNHDTLYLSPMDASLKEVMVLPQNEKIKSIINHAIRNKPLNNPDGYDSYQCMIYYKMFADLLINPSQKIEAPSLGTFNTKARMNSKDSGQMRDFIAKNHLIFSETFSRRSYRRPHQLQEDVLASRFSGLKKTYFTFLVTDVLPFHVYGDYITLNGVDYINPISKGWQQRYQFNLVDEIYHETDTLFILSYRARKNVSFNSLKGIVYINSDGYAISNFISSIGDSSADREARIEQKYEKQDGRWFPRELNYEVVLKKYPNPQTGFRLQGHSVISQISFIPPGIHFDRAHPVTIGDSVDLYSERQWQGIRTDTLDYKERNTYHVLDSISQKVKLEKKFLAGGKLTVGKFGLGPLDLDINRFIIYNQYEGTRLGAGFQTNEKISRYVSLGGWGGYGSGDGHWKYGLSAGFYPFGDKENEIRFSYQDNYLGAGDVHIHTDIDNLGFRNWLLAEVDRIKEFSLLGITQRGYWQLEIHGSQVERQSLYNNQFKVNGEQLQAFHVLEAGIGFRYAYGERRIPLFGYYLPYGTQFPLVYFNLDFGHVNSGTYTTNYIRTLAAITFSKHFNRWGVDKFQWEAGGILESGGQPISRSFLLAGKGFANNVFNYYAWGGFLTMHPYDYFSDKYTSLFYRHSFDKFLWQLTFSKPFITLAHNMLYGGLNSLNRQANLQIQAPTQGYHESGFLLEQLLALNYLHLANLYGNAGFFYHWDGPFDYQKNFRWVAGISIGF